MAKTTRAAPGKGAALKIYGVCKLAKQDLELEIRNINQKLLSRGCNLIQSDRSKKVINQDLVLGVKHQILSDFICG